MNKEEILKKYYASPVKGSPKGEMYSYEEDDVLKAMGEYSLRQQYELLNSIYSCPIDEMDSYVYKKKEEIKSKLK